MDFVYNSQKEEFKNPFGAVEVGSRIDLKIKVKKDIDASCEVFATCDGKEKNFAMELSGTEEEFNVYKVDFKALDKPCAVFYYFIINLKDKRIYLGNQEDGLGGEAKVYDENPIPFQITVHERDIKVPNWFKEGTMYQIFVDRFNKVGKEDLYEGREGFVKYTNWYDKNKYIKNSKGEIIYWDIYGGNLQGIKEKIGYLKDLGVSIIYLNPIFEAHSNNKYDTGDYEKVDEGFGGNEAFDELIEECNKNGINLVLDGVFSHTGYDSKYFNKMGRYDTVGAYQSKDSKYYEWYRFNEYPDDYEAWWGTKNLPNVNEMHPTYIEYMLTGEDSIAKRWIKRGAKGWRLDVADEIPDEFIRTLKEETKKADQESIVIGEVWEDASNKESYGELRKYLLGNELDSVMNYPYRRIFNNFILGNICAEESLRRIMSIYENYPKEYFYSLMNLIGTHDTVRALTVFGDAPKGRKISEEEAFYFELSKEKYKLAVKRLKLASFIQATFPGVPCIYYGDEAGLEGFRDPYCRRTYPWGRENKKLLEWYKKIFNFRKESEILKKGEWKPYFCEGAVFSYFRIKDNDKLLFAVNVSNDKKQIELPEGKWKNIFSNEEGEGKILLEGFSANVFEEVIK